MHRRTIRTGLTLTGLLALTVGLAPALAADTVSWEMPIAFSSSLPGLGMPAKYVSDRVAAMSDGAMQLNVHQPGDLVSPFKILGAVDSGKVAAGYTWLGYERQRIPAAPLFSGVPFGPKPWAFMAWYYQGPGHRLLQEVIANKGYNVHAELCGIVGPETAGWYSHPINSLEDYKGLKIRFGGLGGDVLRKLGADVSTIPASQLIEAIKSGRIQATEFSLPVIDRIIGLDKALKHNLFPGWHQPFAAQYLLVNDDRWRQLSDPQRAMLETVCTAATSRALAQSEYKEGKTLEAFRKEGVDIRTIPVSVLKQLKSVTEDILAREADQDADFKRVYASQRAFQKQYDSWERLGYLPPQLDEE